MYHRISSKGNFKNVVHMLTTGEIQRVVSSITLFPYALFSYLSLTVVSIVPKTQKSDLFLPQRTRSRKFFTFSKVTLILINSIFTIFNSQYLKLKTLTLINREENMGELKDTEVYEEELIDYEEEDEKALDSTKPTTESVKKLVFFPFF